MHYPLLGYASDAEWFALAGSAYGYVRLNAPSNSSCTQPLDADGSSSLKCDKTANRMFVVTMFHEMHCLRLLNLAFDPSDPVGEGHIKHCLNYLRQMILCDADLTLEPADWEKQLSEGGDDLNRQGSTHICRDWETVYDAVEKNWREWVDFSGGRYHSNYHV